MTIEKMKERALKQMEAWKGLLERGSEPGVDYMTATTYVWAYESIGLLTTEEAFGFIAELAMVEAKRRYRI